MRRVEGMELLANHNLHLTSRTYKMLGTVTEESFSKFLDAVLVLKQSDAPITIILNSIGGSVVDGLAIYDLISILTNHVTIIAVGEASSMGSLILQAADTRQMTANARLLLHDGSTGMDDVVARDFDRFASHWKAQRKTFYQIYAHRSGQKPEYFRKKLAHDWYLTAPQALKEGLVDEIL